MATVQVSETCKKCGNEDGIYEYNYKTHEDWFLCEKCGYGYQRRREEIWEGKNLKLGKMIFTEEAPKVIKIPLSELKPIGELPMELKRTTRKNSKEMN